MSYFQNPFGSDFYGVWLLSDRHYNIDFKCPRNSGRGDEMVTVWVEPPYDLSGNDSDGNSKAVLTIWFSLNDPKNWTSLAITISAASLAATTAAEIYTSLTAVALFNDFFTATIENFEPSHKSRLVIKQKKPVTQFRFYIQNGRAESVLKFNRHAGIAELPTYFARHTVANRYTYEDGIGTLIPLLPLSLNVDAALVTAAGLNAAVVKEDYQLLEGRAGLFMINKNTVDSSSRITESIQYGAGAIAGDVGKKITYTFSGAKTQPDSIVEKPYTLTSGDIL